MWCDGGSLAEIAEALDSTSNSIGVQIAQMRDDGWVLPYRRPGWQPKHPGLKAVA